MTDPVTYTIEIRSTHMTFDPRDRYIVRIARGVIHAHGFTAPTREEAEREAGQWCNNDLRMLAMDDYSVTTYTPTTVRSA